MRVTFAYEDQTASIAAHAWRVKFVAALLSVAVVILGCVCLAG
jgi:hypothetical protein